MHAKLHELLEKAYTVDLIMTPREQLYCVAEGERPSPEIDYDLVPVVEKSSNTIVGLWVRCMGSYECIPLSEKWLISSSASIRYLMQLFTPQKPPRSMLVVDGGRIVGIVSHADLGKVASRAYLYTLFAEMELLMAKLIRSVLSDTEALAELSSKRQQDLQEHHQQLKASGEHIDFVSLMSLADLVNIVAKRKELRTTLGYLSRSSAENALNPLVHIRNCIAHPIRKLMVEQIVNATFTVELLIERLNE